MGGIVRGGVWVAESRGKFGGSLGSCLTRLERARSAVGRRRLGLLCWALNPCMRWWKASTGRASPDSSYLDLLSLLISVASKLCQAFPVIITLADEQTYMSR
eukprot:1146942-Pelagomonas_calceolata.AAC.2